MTRPPTSGRDDEAVKGGNLALLFELLGERDVFHDRNIGKSAHRQEYRFSDEESLVTGGDIGYPRAKVHEPGYPPQPSLVPVKPDIKSSADDVRIL